MMKVLMYCSGINTELRPFSDMMPKSLLPIKGKPILYHNLDWLHKFNVEGIVISSSYRHNQLKMKLDSYKSSIPIHLHREPKIVGTAKTLKNMHYKFDDEPFVFLHGDVLYDFNLDEAYLKHKKKNKAITLICHRGKGINRNKNIVKMQENNENNIDKIIVKPYHTSEYEMIMTSGAFISNPSIHSKITDKHYDLIDDLLPEMVSEIDIAIEQQNKIFYSSNDYMQECKTWSSYDFIYY